MRNPRQPRLVLGMSPRSPARVALLVLLFVASACGAGRPVRPKPAGEQYLIAQSELEATRQQNLYDAIRQVRPFWLGRDRRQGTGGSSEIVVYLDEHQIGGVGQLTRLPVSAVARVRYLSATEAQVRFGTMNGLRPAIVVESARR